MSTKTPNYVLSLPYTYNHGSYDTKILEPGTFVRPIELQYVPQHVIDNPMWRGFNKGKEIFCYTKYGFLAIPKASIRET